MKRLTLATVLAVTFVVAGCSGIGGDGLPLWAKDAFSRSESPG